MTEKEIQLSNHYENGDASKMKDEIKKSIPTIRTYSHRNSVLTDLMNLKHVETVYNISVAGTVLLGATMAAYYLTLPHKLWEDLGIMQRATSKLHIASTYWLGLNFLCCSVYFGMRFWAKYRNSLSLKVADAFFILYFILHITIMYTFTPLFVQKFELPIITSFALLCEQVRLFMKIYSYVRENYPRIQKYNAEKDDGQKNYFSPSLSHFIFFLFAPVLIYRDSYPRTENIRWKFVVSSFGQFIACIFITYCLFMRFNVDVFQNVGLEPFHTRHLALIAAGSIFVGSVMMFMLFYCIIHSWLNFCAELARFGDRKFYEDWWNSTSFLQYYRKMNSVVYDWLYAYVYEDIHKLGLNRSAARLNVFVVSSIAHDYIICYTLGYFFPALGIVYTTIGVLVIFITNQKTTSFWNTFMWIFLFAGWGTLIFMHSVEWFSRKNCPTPPSNSLGFYIRSLSCLKIDDL